jgi:uncharacterized membrane protein
MHILILLSALGAGLIAGAFFAFSSFIMAALARLPAAHGIAAMQAINITVINPVFMLAFAGTAAAGIALAVLAFLDWGDPRAWKMLMGGALYVFGVFGLTMAMNVPLNNALAGVDPGSVSGAELWARYLKDWTFWNHVRTVASAAASLVLMLALA